MQVNSSQKLEELHIGQIDSEIIFQDKLTARLCLKETLH